MKVPVGFMLIFLAAVLPTLPQPPDRLPITDVVHWIQVIWRGIVLRRQPVVVAMVVRLRLLVGIKLAVEMPLACVTGFVATLLQQ